MIFSPLIVQLQSLQVIGAFLFALVMAFISYKIKAISLSGAAGMVAIGTVVFGLGGVIFTIPLLFFFISSTLLSIVKNNAKRRTLQSVEKAGSRDIWQVLANGGPGAICVLMYFGADNIIWFFPYLASICEAASDTWATEIGTLYRGSPRSIVTLESVPPGQSGGLSILGSVAAIGGALATMLVTLIADKYFLQGTSLPINYWLVAANCGLAGCILDSILGGSLQGQYYCEVCRRSTESEIHCGKPGKLNRGYRFVNNDIVNFASTIFAAAIAALLIFYGR